MPVLFSTAELLDYLRRSRLATVATIGPDGAPQSALVGIGATDDLRVVFDTTSNSRKHANLLRDPRASVVVAGPGEQTLQYEGFATPVSVTDPADAAIREAYYQSCPDGRGRLAWPCLSYWGITPTWARFTDYERGPLLAYFVAAEGVTDGAPRLVAQPQPPRVD